MRLGNGSLMFRVLLHFSAFSKAPLSHPKPPCGIITSRWLNLLQKLNSASVDKSEPGVRDFRFMSACCLTTVRKKVNHVWDRDLNPPPPFVNSANERVRGRHKRKGESLRGQQKWRRNIMFFLLFYVKQIAGFSFVGSWWVTSLAGWKDPDSFTLQDRWRRQLNKCEQTTLD